MAAKPDTAVVPIAPDAEAKAEPVATPPFDSWTYEDAEKALKETLPEDHEVRRAYASESDHWQEGKQWVGPGEATTNERIEEQFAPDDAIGEALANVGNAFSEPRVGVAPLEPIDGEVPPDLQKRVDEATTLLSAWWDRRRLQEHVQDRLRTSAWAGRAGLRLWIPGRYMLRGADGSVRLLEAEDLPAALSLIHIAAPDPAASGVVIDGPTQAECAVTLDEEEITDSEGKNKKVKRAELVYREEDPLKPWEAGRTVIRVVYEKEAQDARQVELDIGGRLTVAEMRARSLLTDPVLRGQRQLNYLSSLLTRIAETGGFPERNVINAKPQGERRAYKEGDTIPPGAFLDPDDTGRLWVVIPEERTLGANTTTEWVGLPKMNEEAQVVGYEAVQVERFEPVDPTPYVNLAEAVRGKVLRMCRQGHLAGTDTGEASGLAYEQARAAFSKDLNARRVAEEGMLRELLTSALALAEDLAGQPGYFTEQLRVTVDQHVDTGPRSPDSVRSDVEAYDKGLLSRPSAMARIGVEDVDAETELIRAGVRYLLDTLAKAGEASTVFSADGVLRALVEGGSLTQEVADAVLARDTDELPEGGQ